MDIKTFFPFLRNIQQKVYCDECECCEVGMTKVVMIETSLFNETGEKITVCHDCLANIAFLSFLVNESFKVLDKPSIN